MVKYDPNEFFSAERKKKMKKPPVKAIEQIKKYCEKTQCRKCVFGEPEKEFVSCELMEIPPCDWEIEEGEET